MMRFWNYPYGRVENLADNAVIASYMVFGSELDKIMQAEELVVDYRKRLKRKIAVSFSLLLLIGILYFLQQNVEAFKDAISVDLLFTAPFSNVK